MRRLGRLLSGPKRAATEATADGVCAHGPCTCPAQPGSAFCSDWCSGAHGEECHCHHGTCHAPHHH